MQRTCNVAFIGAGGMAREHIRAFHDIPGVSLAGIYSRTRTSAEKLASEFGIGKVCGSIEDLHRETQADLLVVAVPELALNEVCRHAFVFPWTVMVEKPAGYNVSDAEAINDLGQQEKCNVIVALNRRHCSSIRSLVDRLGKLSGPRFIRIVDQEDPKRALEAGQPPLVVANWMYANAIHLIDLFRVMGRGKIVSVDPVVPWNPSNPGILVSHLTYDSGDIGLYEGLWNRPGPWMLNVSTLGEFCELRPIERLSYQVDGDRKFHAVDPHQWDLDFKPGFRLQAEMAVASALGKPSQSISLGDSLESMYLVQKIFSH